MREILFRGFHPDENGKEKVLINYEWKNGFWVYGDLNKEYEDSFFITTWFGDYDDIESYYIFKETIGQCIGFKDKNRKKIFEGDIVDLSNCRQLPFIYDEIGKISVVEWKKYYAGFYPFCNYDSDCGTSVCSEEVKVIGNIFDNPDIVKFMEC